MGISHIMHIFDIRRASLVLSIKYIVKKQKVIWCALHLSLVKKKNEIFHVLYKNFSTSYHFICHLALYKWEVIE